MLVCALTRLLSCARTTFDAATERRTLALANLRESYSHCFIPGIDA
jgi:hypothetical protein